MYMESPESSEYEKANPEISLFCFLKFDEEDQYNATT